MEFKKHVENCLKEAREKYPEICEDAKLEEIVRVVNKWVDGRYFAHKEMSHRIERHHVEGVEQAIEVFSKQYGERYSSLIRCVAEKHILDDWEGIRKTVPRKSDYEILSSWLMDSPIRFNLKSDV